MYFLFGSISSIYKSCNLIWFIRLIIVLNQLCIWFATVCHIFLLLRSTINSFRIIPSNIIRLIILIPIHCKTRHLSSYTSKLCANSTNGAAWHLIIARTTLPPLASFITISSCDHALHNPMSTTLASLSPGTTFCSATVPTILPTSSYYVIVLLGDISAWDGWLSSALGCIDFV